MGYHRKQYDKNKPRKGHKGKRGVQEERQQDKGNDRQQAKQELRKAA